MREFKTYFVSVLILVIIIITCLIYITSNNYYIDDNNSKYTEQKKVQIVENILFSSIRHKALIEGVYSEEQIKRTFGDITKIQEINVFNKIDTNNKVIFNLKIENNQESIINVIKMLSNSTDDIVQEIYINGIITYTNIPNKAIDDNIEAINKNEEIINIDVHYILDKSNIVKLKNLLYKVNILENNIYNLENQKNIYTYTIKIIIILFSCYFIFNYIYKRFLAQNIDEKNYNKYKANLMLGLIGVLPILVDILDIYININIRTNYAININTIVSIVQSYLFFEYFYILNSKNKYQVVVKKIYVIIIIYTLILVSLPIATANFYVYNIKVVVELFTIMLIISLLYNDYKIKSIVNIHSLIMLLLLTLIYSSSRILTYVNIINLFYYFIVLLFFLYSAVNPTSIDVNIEKS